MLNFKKQPKFWYKDNADWQAKLLFPLSYIWLKITEARQKNIKAYKASVPVICVGSPMIGGTGKTPTTLYIADGLKKLGLNPAILSRGYGGQHVKSDHTHLIAPDHDQAIYTGDEALMMARHHKITRHPIFIDKRRDRAARMAIEHGADCLIMDDGRLHPYLEKDIHIITIDGDVELGNERVIPAGPMREDGLEVLSGGDMVLVIGGDGHNFKQNHPNIKSVYYADYRLDENIEKNTADLKKSNIVAFSGLANGDKFRNFLKKLGLNIYKFYDYGDHHLYDQEDEAFLRNQSKLVNAKLATTAKDAIKLSPEFLKLVTVIDIDLCVYDGDIFINKIYDKVKKVQNEKASSL